jgi:hypothetical protein
MGAPSGGGSVKRSVGRGTDTVDVESGATSRGRGGVSDD